MVNILLIQDTDWIARGPHQQHHILERLDQEKYSIWVVDFEILWNKRKAEGIFQKGEVFHDVSHVRENKIEIVRPSMIRIPLLDKLTIPIFHMRAIKKIIKEKKIDLIIGQTILNTFCGLILSKIYKIPFVFHVMDSVHSISSDYIPRYFLPIAKFLERLIIKFATSIITVNEGLRDYLIRLGGNPGKISVISEGVDYEKYQAAKIKRNRMRKELGLKERDLVLFFMGWLYSFSGLKELANGILNYSKPEIKLLIVGKGDLFPFLSELAQQSNQIIVTGQVPFKKIPNYLSAADIGVLPAHQNEIMMDIVPIKIIEYMAAGKPVISTKLRGIMREFGKNNGIIYCSNIQEFIQTAVRLKGDKELDVMGEKGAQRVKGRDWKVLIEQFEKELIKLIRQKG